MLSHGPVIIYGCGGHSRSVADVLLDNEPGASLVFIDQNAGKGESILGFPVLQAIPPDLKGERCIIAVGDNERREKIAREIGPGALISVISRKAHLGRGSSVTPGCFIGCFCHLGPGVRVGENAIINTGSIIEHEVTIGAFCHIGPNATVSGRSSLGDDVFLGVGATIIDKIAVCSRVMIGAGATVIQDITEPGTYAGTPARKIK